MSVNVQGPDGKTYAFPDGTDKSAAIAYFKRKGIGGSSVEQNRKATADRAAWMKVPHSNKPAPVFGRNDADRFKMDLSSLTENASPILATAGAVGGGAVAGPPGAVAGAAYGGYVGKGIERDVGGEPRSAGAELTAGAEQGALELAGGLAAKGVGKLIGPAVERLAPKAIQRLTRATAEKSSAGVPHEAIERTIGDIEKELLKLPPQERTVGGFLDAVTKAREGIHAEYGNALGPYARQEVNTRPIADAIRALKKPWMDVPGMGAEEKAAIDKAATQFERPMTAGQLDSLREQLNTDLASLYGKAPNARYTATQGSINNAIDTTIAKGARDILYPLADNAGGKPAGYFKDALDREGSLIQLRGILQQRLTNLSGAQAVSEVTPRLSSENVSLSAHPTSLPRAGVYGLKNLIAPPRELATASKQVAKAVTSKPEIDSLPYQLLFSTGLRGGQVADREKKRLAKILTPVPMQ
jgi:hypothetical protein